MEVAKNEQLIFQVKDDKEFEAIALDIFRYQAENNAVYGRYLDYLGVNRSSIISMKDIPFLPIELFKTQRVIISGPEPELMFESSGTTGQELSKHYIARAAIYEESFLHGFTKAFGSPEGICILALLPSYVDRPGSSLVYMVDKLVKLSKQEQSGFYQDNLNELVTIMKFRSANALPTLLFGVSFALLNLAEQYATDLKKIKIIETGGMKGRRQELTREELHSTLKEAFNVESIYSEYGMTELLSQAYTDGTELFTPSSTMKILIRDPYDPFSLLPANTTGSINVIDLANIYSCSFIATADLGIVLPDGRFKVLGRMDQSDIRGCNLLVETN